MKKEVELLRLRLWGKWFALNGTARTRGYEDVLPIWLHNPDNQELRVSTRDVLNKALALCD